MISYARSGKDAEGRRLSGARAAELTRSRRRFELIVEESGKRT